MLGDDVEIVLNIAGLQPRRGAGGRPEHAPSRARPTPSGKK